jgi:hypothetical protein
MNLTSARERLSNNFSYGVSIICRAKQAKVRRERVEPVKLIPDIARFFRSNDLL